MTVFIEPCSCLFISTSFQDATSSSFMRGSLCICLSPYWHFQKSHLLKFSFRGSSRELKGDFAPFISCSCFAHNELAYLFQWLVGYQETLLHLHLHMYISWLIIGIIGSGWDVSFICVWLVTNTSMCFYLYLDWLSLWAILKRFIKFLWAVVFGMLVIGSLYGLYDPT